MLWPAVLNGYPILFSDTQAFLVQGGTPTMIWDKPFAYGPLLRLLHSGTTLWIPAVVQALLVSHLLWLARGIFAPPGLLRHVLLCAALAGLTTAAWTTSLIMPDIFAPITVLCLFILVFGDGLDASVRVWAAILAVIAIAVHLSHLVIAAACIAAIAVLRTTRVPRAVLPLAVAVALLIVSNLVGFGRFAVSPFGSVVLLGRLTADGLVAPTLARDCARTQWRLCAWAGRLPADSNAFVWDRDGPVWTYPGGPIGMAREAGEINLATLSADPGRAATAALANSRRQLLMAGLGETLHPTALEGPGTNALRTFFPPAELARFRASLQAADKLAPIAEPLAQVITIALGAGAALLCLMLGSVFVRGQTPHVTLAVLVVVGVAANAFATGALANPQERYGARIAWLIVAAPLLAGLPRRRAEG
jgi:hypothetical protein